MFKLLARLLGAAKKTLSTAKKTFSTAKMSELTKTQRQNAIFKNRLNQAGVKQPKKANKLRTPTQAAKQFLPKNLAKTPTSNAQIKIFYRLTQNLWQGLDTGKRNEIIIKKLGVDTLEEAYQKVMTSQAAQEELAKIYNLMQNAGSTEDFNDLIDDSVGSPQYNKIISPIDFR